MVCARVTQTARDGIPILSLPTQPNLNALTCYSDAAGCKFMMVGGMRKGTNKEDDRGVASIILNRAGNIIAWSRFSWPTIFLEQAKDRAGHQSSTINLINRPCRSKP
jgi:hypothetical protein